MSSDGKSSNHFQTNNGETSSVRKKNVPIRVAVPDSATAHNSATLHNNTTVLNNETVPISATITNSASVLNSATVPNNSTSLNSNKTSSNFQTTDNEVNYNPNVIIQQLIIPPEMATYPIKYIVVDDNMQPIGIIANPQQNSGPTSNIESLKKYMPDNTKDTREITNSSNTVDSTVQQHNNGEIINLSCMKPGLKDMRTASIENTEVSTGSTAIAGINSVNKNSFESTSKNSKAYVDINRGLKSNIGYFITKSLQNNEVSTNSDADFITINDVEDEHVSQKSTENESRSCELQLHTGSTASDKTCGIVNDAGSSNTDLNKIIKKEKLDIPRMLEALGDNYTVKILSIEDPFEVIGISDSSDSEDGL